MRKVKVYKNHRKDGEHREAVFHQWGLDGTCSVAIVEYSDGSLERIPPEYIQFTEKEDEAINPLWAIATWLERICSRL